jgi:hypothetical protein
LQLLPPPPVTWTQRPGFPPLAEQACPQQSSLLQQTSPTGWQEYALAQKPLWQLVEQHWESPEQV